VVLILGQCVALCYCSSVHAHYHLHPPLTHPALPPASCLLHAAHTSHLRSSSARCCTLHAHSHLLTSAHTSPHHLPARTPHALLLLCLYHTLFLCGNGKADQCVDSIQWQCVVTQPSVWPQQPSLFLHIEDDPTFTAHVSPFSHHNDNEGPDCVMILVMMMMMGR